MTSQANASYCNSLWKTYQMIIQRPGKVWDSAKVLFKSEVKDAGGIRFFHHHDEQIVQIIQFGIDNVLKELGMPCNTNSWSKESSKNLLLNFDGTKNLVEVTIEMIESAAISNVGSILV